MVFGVKFSAKKLISQNCPIKRARRASPKGNLEKIDFLAENFTQKTSKMTKFRRRAENFERAVDDVDTGYGAMFRPLFDELFCGLQEGDV